MTLPDDELSAEQHAAIVAVLRLAAMRGRALRLAREKQNLSAQPIEADKLHHDDETGLMASVSTKTKPRGRRPNSEPRGQASLFLN